MSDKIVKIELNSITSQPLNLDVKVDDELNVVVEPMEEDYYTTDRGFPLK